MKLKNETNLIFLYQVKILFAENYFQIVKRRAKALTLKVKNVTITKNK